MGSSRAPLSTVALALTAPTSSLNYQRKEICVESPSEAWVKLGKAFSFYLQTALTIYVSLKRPEEAARG